MLYPWQLNLRLSSYVLKQKIVRRGKFPWVLMLEPLFKCNLSCSGCGRIREYREYIDLMLSPEQCLKAALECGAPLVCITGGEPLLHPQIKEIVEKLISHHFFIFLATNGILLEKSLDQFTPSPYLSIVIHLDGLKSTHDRLVEREGVFDIAIKGLREAKRRGFRVLTNTTVYKRTEPRELWGLFYLLTSLSIDGIILSPAFSYGAVGEKDVFLSREEIRKLFQELLSLNQGKARFFNSPLYLDFLSGKKELICFPWGCPSYTPLGWRSPCYWLADTHYPTFKELLSQTPWEKYGWDKAAKDPRCSQCLTHGGFESSALSHISFKDIFRLIKWQLS